MILRFIGVVALTGVAYFAIWVISEAFKKPVRYERVGYVHQSTVHNMDGWEGVPVHQHKDGDTKLNTNHVAVYRRVE